MEKKKSKIKLVAIISILIVIVGIIIACFIGYIAKLIHTDYDFWGVIIVFMFYLFKYYY